MQVSLEVTVSSFILHFYLPFLISLSFVKGIPLSFVACPLPGEIAAGWMRSICHMN
jgi:hypothetical protein